MKGVSEKQFTKSPHQQRTDEYEVRIINSYMADNYLEKQYADYEKRRAEWERQKKLGKLPKKKA